MSGNHCHSRLALLALTTAVLSICPPLAAHDPATLDSLPAKHGGRVRMAGPFHVELVLSSAPSGGIAPIWVYLQSHAFEDVPAKGVAATVEFRDGARATDVTLRQKGFNLLFGMGAYRITPTLQVEVTLKRAGEEAVTASFSPYQSR